MGEEDEWWRGAVIYQIYPRSFMDADGDGVGDLKGVLAKLDYVAALGVDGIWVSPFFTSPMKDFGYDVSDYCAVDPLFGTLADFDAVVAKAHASRPEDHYRSGVVAYLRRACLVQGKRRLAGRP